MRRYWLFGGDNFYASGGMQDFIGSFDDCDAAWVMAERMLRTKDIDWWHIFDSQCGIYMLSHNNLSPGNGPTEIEDRGNEPCF